MSAAKECLYCGDAIDNEGFHVGYCSAKCRELDLGGEPLPDKPAPKPAAAGAGADADEAALERGGVTSTRLAGDETRFQVKGMEARTFVTSRRQCFAADIKSSFAQAIRNAEARQAAQVAALVAAAELALRHMTEHGGTVSGAVPALRAALAKARPAKETT